MRHLAALVFWVAFAVSLVMTVGSWVDRDSTDRVTVATRVAGPLVLTMLTWILIADRARKQRERQPAYESLPDELAGALDGGGYFECRGFCFAFAPVVQDGVSWMRIWFQNRYANPCTARVVLQSRRRFLSLRRLPFSGLDARVDCDGGAFGVYQVEWSIPSGLQGREFKCEVAASAHYPNGRGPAVRPGKGTPVLAPEPTGILARLASGAMLTFVAGVGFEHATLTLRLPDGVADAPLGNGGRMLEVFSRPNRLDAIRAGASVS